MGKILVIIGLVIIVIGVLMIFKAPIPLGRLPGDIAIEGKHVWFYFPFVTCIIISILFSLLLYFFR